MLHPESLLMATTTVATSEQADTLAREIVAGRCAACVQIEGPITSHYIWEGAVQRETEWRLTIKTTRAALATLTELVHHRHPYELPQWWVMSPEVASEAYARWVQESVQPQ